MHCFISLTFSCFSMLYDERFEMKPNFKKTLKLSFWSRSFSEPKRKAWFESVGVVCRRVIPTLAPPAALDVSQDTDPLRIRDWKTSSNETRND